MKKSVIVISIILFLVGYFTLNNNEVTIDWTGLTALDQRAHALDIAERELEKLDRSDIYLYLSKEDMDTNLTPIIAKELATIEIKNAQHVHISNLRIDFVPQGIKVVGEFDIRLEEPDYTFKGTVDGVVATGIRNSDLVLLPAFIDVDLTSVDKSRIEFHWKDILNPKLLWKKLRLRFGNDIANELSKVVVDNFLDTINGVVFDKPIEWPINLNAFGKVSAMDLLKTDEGKGDERVAMPNLHLSTAVFNITPTGLVLLAELSSDAEASDSLGPFKTLKLEERWTQAEFDARYQAFNQKFSAKRQLITLQTSSVSEVVIRTALVARTFNDMSAQLGTPIGELVTTMPDEAASFSEHPRLYKKEHIRCGSLRKDCEAKRKSCQNTRSCARNCSRFDLFCKTRAEACRVAARAEAEACRIAARAEAEACRAGQDLEVANCKLNNAAKVGACKAKVEAMRMLEDFVDIGEIKGTATVSNIRIASVINTVQLSDDLASVTVNADLNASANIGVDIDLNPEGIGHIVCLWKTKPTINTVVNIDQSDVNFQGKVSQEAREDGTLMLRMAVTSDPITAHAEPSPWKELTRNTSFTLSCSVAEFALGAAGLLDLLGVINMPEPAKTLITGSYTYRDLEYEMEYPVEPIFIDASGDELKFMPHWDGATIGFKRL